MTSSSSSPGPRKVKVIDGKPASAEEWKVFFKDYIKTRDFGKHNHSVSVCLYQNPNTKHKLVQKTFGPKQEKHFNREISNLKHLKGCLFIPKLHHIDTSTKTLYLSYCGRRPRHLTDEQKADIRDKLKLLKEQYGLSRNFFYPTHLGFPKRDNITMDHGEMKLIDFGPPWKIATKMK